MRNSPLFKPAVTLLVLVGAFLSFLGYWTLLLEWVRAYRTGVYEPIKAVCEITALLLYLYAGVRFLRIRIRFF